MKKILIAGVTLLLSSCELYVPETGTPPALGPSDSLTVIMRENDGWRERCVNEYNGTPNFVAGNTINPSWDSNRLAVCQNALTYHQ